MSVRAIVSGALFKAPIEKMSKAGKPYLLVTVREGKGDGIRWFKALIFADEVCDEVRRISDGEPIALCGEVDVQLYEKGGEQRLGWSIVADGVLTARRRAKPRAERTGGVRRQDRRTGPEIAKTSWAAPTLGGGFADDDRAV